MTATLRHIATGLALLAAPISAEAQSAYGCEGLTGLLHRPAVEGDGGVFYRIDPDMRMHHAFSDATITDMAKLSRALETAGTLLVYAPVPTKSVAMPAMLGSEALDLSFDVDLATTVQTEVIRRLEEEGVAVADIRRQMLSSPGAEPPFLEAGSLWTASGAQAAAHAIAARISKATGGGSHSPRAARPLGWVEVESEMRAQLQGNCAGELPPARTLAYDLSASATPTFGGLARPRIVLVGSEYAAFEAANLPGFLALETGLEVEVHAVEEAGAFAAISSYVTSAAFREAPPAVLVWENPVWNSLADRGDQPMGELIAAAGGVCNTPVPMRQGTRRGEVVADLTVLQGGGDYTLMLDAAAAAGAGPGHARFAFISAGGERRTRGIWRAEGTVDSGRYYMPLTGLWQEGAVAVEISAPAAAAEPRLMACLH